MSQQKRVDCTKKLRMDEDEFAMRPLNPSNETFLFAAISDCSCTSVKVEL